MQSQEERLFVPEGNSPDITFTVRDASTGNVLSLGGSDGLEFYIKPSASTSDDDPFVTVLTRANNDFTLPDPALMSGSVKVPDTALTEPGVFFYRLDVIVNGRRRTEKYGPLVIVNV